MYLKIGLKYQYSNSININKISILIHDAIKHFLKNSRNSSRKNHFYASKFLKKIIVMF
jgi:hypothetical protein